MADGNDLAARRPDRRLRRRRWLLAAPLVLVGAVATAVAISPRPQEPRRPAFAEGGLHGFASAPIGSVYQFGVPGDEDRDVTVLEFQPRWQPGSAQAVVSMDVCDPLDESSGDVLRGGIALDLDPDVYCSVLRPAVGVDLGATSPDALLLVTVVVTSEAPLWMDGIDLTYEQGGRTVTQQVGPVLEIGGCPRPSGDGC